MKKDVHQIITDKIIEQLEKGTRPWVKSWEAGIMDFPKRHNGENYQGINVLVLWIEAMEKGYSNPYWMTFKQAIQYGGHVRKGEKGTAIVYFKQVVKIEKDKETGEEKKFTFPIIKSYFVFNVDQIDGLPEKFEMKPITKRENNHIPKAKKFFDNLGMNLKHGGGRAYYSPSADRVQMPEVNSFHSIEAYYATLAHESVHWTKHPERCNRDLGRKSWGDEGYALEELVAELGAAFVCVERGFTPEVREDHASYIASWLKVLKNDKKAIFTASSHAQKAVEFMHSQQDS